MKSRRTVIHNDKERPYGKGRVPKMWAYGYSDLAKLLGTTVGALRARVGRGWDPSSLEAVCRERDLRRSRLARQPSTLPGALALAPEAATIVIMPGHGESFED